MTEYRLIREEDIKDALAISLTQLGSDYLDENDFKDAMSSDDQFCMIASVDGKVAGFAICQVFGPDREPELLKLPDCPERDVVMSTGLIGLLDSVAVSPDFKGRGVGTEMCNECVREMKSRGCGMVCAMAWKSYLGKTNIGGILTKMGLRETIAIQGYWNTMVDSPEGHDCPICGAPCKCYGVFWYRQI